MTTSAPDLPPDWGPAPNGRSAHALLEPLYTWADTVTAAINAGSGTSVTDNGNGTATLDEAPGVGGAG